MKKKLSLEELKVNSFLTSSNSMNEQTPAIKGGIDWQSIGQNLTITLAYPQVEEALFESLALLSIEGVSASIVGSAIAVSEAAVSGYALGYVSGAVSDYISNAASIGDREDASDYISQMLPSVRTLCPCW